MARPGKEKAIAPASMEMDELLRKRDAFVTSMTLLRNAADEASRAGLVFFDLFIGSGTEQQQQSHVFFQRGPTEEPEGPKKRAKRAKRDPAMPKRPMTAYLLFCHQGRETVKADLGPDATHKDVIAELTKRWSDTPDDQKKAWQDLYQKNREVYAKDMAQYKAAKGQVLGESSTIGFTAVNVESDNVQESDAESDKVADEHVESEAEAEEDDAEEEEEEEEEEEIRSPTPPPPRKKATPRAKKAATANGNLKKTVTSVAPSTSSPAAAGPKAKAEPTKRKRTRTKKVLEEEAAASDGVTPKKKATRKRRKSSD